jgi:hypothetical protein
MIFVPLKLFFTAILLFFLTNGQLWRQLYNVHAVYVKKAKEKCCFKTEKKLLVWISVHAAILHAAGYEMQAWLISACNTAGRTQFLIKEKRLNLKGTVSRDGYFFEGLNVLLRTFWVCADGFQGLSKAFHYPLQFLTVYLLF